MIIGLPKECKNGEHRVALTPSGVATLTRHGHQLSVQHGAGEGSGYADADYLQAGAQMVDRATAWQADLVVKVKEPLPEEFPFLRPELTLFTYLHLAANPVLTRELQRQQVTAIGYETVQNGDGSLPLLAPMSRIAGRVAMQMATRFLQSENGTPYPGYGILPGGMSDSEAAQVLILGGGNAGLHAAHHALGTGASVTLFDRNPDILPLLRKQLGDAVTLKRYDHQQVIRQLPTSHIVIGAALIPAARAPLLLTADDLSTMQPGTVLVDIAIDQGGVSATSRVTSYADPVYVEHRVIHCCLPNLPSAVARTATQSLTSVTLPWVLRLADEGIDAAIAHYPPLAAGLNVHRGAITHPAVADALSHD